ncbi:unnamed protein product [Peniophora sp. CBMAI 1063]|nr:unnamed protein product [Peniophora sp. CBMAI 1063]
MNAADPTYPLYPIVSFFAAAMLLMVLLTSFIRQSWNLGVALLCFWLCLNNLAGGVSAIIWSDNADVKLYTFCDIVSHLYVITCVTKPMATLVITRRLYVIASLRSVSFPSKTARRWDLLIELTLGLGVPLLVAGPLYYINQSNRFEVNEGFGCANSQRTSILEILTIESWTIVPPLISIVFYYPRVVRTFYRQSQDVNSFLSSDNSISRTNYFRVLVLASIDIVLTLPTSVVTIVLRVTSGLEQGSLPFYWGWASLHSDWDPSSISYAEIMDGKASSIAQYYYSYWTAPILAIAIFFLFGLTAAARASYWRCICTIRPSEKSV